MQAPAPIIIVHQSPPQYKARDFRHDPILATEEKYCYPIKTKISVHNKNLHSSLKFQDVTTTNILFKCEGKLFSLTDKKVLKDGESGQEIFSIKKELLTFAEIYKMSCKRNKEICKLTVERSPSKAKLIGQFTDGGVLRNERKFMVKANLERKHCCIYLQDGSLIPMATMEIVEKNKSHKPEVLLGGEVYVIEIEAGVDAALILGLCVIVMDENAGFGKGPPLTT